MAKKIASKHAETTIERIALRWLNSHGEGYDNGAAGAARDLFYGGCAAGTVGDLVYYTDTVKFYKKHRDEIGKMLAELCADTGCQPGELLNGWDKEDPLALDTSNQNLLAWFGFEQAALRVCDRAGIES